jgi:diacylglycerol kinase family enzyme
MSASAEKPGTGRRLAAVAAICMVVLALALGVTSIPDDAQRFTVQAPLLLVALLAAWYALTRAGRGRLIGMAVCVAAIAGIIAYAFVEGRAEFVVALIRIVLLLAAVVFARHALALDIGALKETPTPGEAVPASKRGVLIVNPKSGGGKAERFRLEEESRARGIEPVVLRAGDDLLEMARDALDSGADVIGMAGGDGSQALVASIAAERGVSMVIVPAGTRNHLALDLGLDRDDVVGALDAFDEAVERSIDLADVNGRVFVNNVSLGLYASIIRSPEYRDAKIDTTLAALPKMLGPGASPFDLRFKGPAGEDHVGAHLVQISNNPYGNTVDGLTSRPRLDTHRLGIIALEIDDDRSAASFIAAVAAGRAERFSGFTSWVADAFEVTSGTTIDVGLDGESLTLAAPLVFSIRADPLRVRLPAHAIGSSPAGRSLGWRSAARGVVRVALGRAVTPHDPRVVASEDVSS